MIVGFGGERKKAFERKKTKAAFPRQKGPGNRDQTRGGKLPIISSMKKEKTWAGGEKKSSDSKKDKPKEGEPTSNGTVSP